jgi:hypothetical protein
MHAALIEGIPAAAGRSLAEALEIDVSRLGIEDVVFARRVVNVRLARPIICCASSNSAAFAAWLMSPVWIMNVGLSGIATILSIAALRVTRASGLAGLANPMWLSEI